MSSASHRPAGPSPSAAPPGRGTGLNPPNRFEPITIVPDPDADLGPEFSEPSHPHTQFFDDGTESVLTRNDSPDLGFDWGLNPYRGCEHGCAYCYARPYHNYLGWSSGLDFETRILVKRRAPALLLAELSSPRWKPAHIALSGATDCYQPAERHFRLTRGCLEVLAEFRNPVGIVTKNFLVTRDLDLLVELARWRCIGVSMTITTLDADLAGKLEPRAARPEHRLRAIRLLADAGIPVGVNVAPVIPGLTDHELPDIIKAASEAGAGHARYIVLRLPWSVKDIFVDWLDTHVPGKKERVLSRIRDLRGGELNVAEWGKRLKGEGIFAEQIHALFAATTRRLGLNADRNPLSTEHFRPPGGQQLTLL